MFSYPGGAQPPPAPPPCMTRFDSCAWHPPPAEFATKSKVGMAERKQEGHAGWGRVDSTAATACAPAPPAPTLHPPPHTTHHTHTRTQDKGVDSPHGKLAPLDLLALLQVYSFFLLTEDLAVANSSGGPKTLMYRVK